MKLSARHTKRAAYVGYLTQAIVINFFPLLFVTFQKDYDFSLSHISLIIAVCFTTQLLTDLIAARFSSKLPLRLSVVMAHVLAVIGMIGMGVLPLWMPPLLGILIGVILAAIGGGLIEVLISPIVEACPTDGKSAAMSLLHSFYSWGLASVVIFSTIFFQWVGIAHWHILSCLWALIPAVGAVAFCFVPIYDLDQETKHVDANRSLIRSSVFWAFFLLMFAAGASEAVMSQWASGFAESGLQVSKTLGDLMGPCAFALLMGTARILYARFEHKIRLGLFFLFSALLCILTYLVAALSPHPLPALIACALCGFSTGIMWPGTYSLATVHIPWGGVRMFALLALGGDLGCLTGPALAGWIADLCNNNLKIAFLFSALFPIIAAVVVICLLKRERSISKSFHKKGRKS